MAKSQTPAMLDISFHTSYRCVSVCVCEKVNVTSEMRLVTQEGMSLILHRHAPLTTTFDARLHGYILLFARWHVTAPFSN